MQTITYYPKSLPSLDEVRRFVQSFPEGDWVTETGISRGIIESEGEGSTSTTTIIIANTTTNTLMHGGGMP